MNCLNRRLVALAAMSVLMASAAFGRPPANPADCKFSDARCIEAARAAAARAVAEEEMPVGAATKLDRWLLGGRAVQPADALTASARTYLVKLGQADARYLYPVRIVQMLPASLDGWVPLVDFAQDAAAASWGNRYLSVQALQKKAAELTALAASNPAGRASLDALQRSRATVFGLVLDAAVGDANAVARYKGLAMEMASDPFMRSVFDAATVAKSAVDEFQQNYDRTDSSTSYRYHATMMMTILTARDLNVARAAYVTFRENTYVAAPKSPDWIGEETKRPVPNCGWDSGRDLDGHVIEQFRCR